MDRDSTEKQCRSFILLLEKLKAAEESFDGLPVAEIESVWGV